MRPRGPWGPPCRVRRVECRHGIEVEVYPAAAEVYFSDEAYVDPAQTQVRFRAAVLNGQTPRVRWQVVDTAGNPGAGSIDGTGLYRAPAKGSLVHGTTDLVIASSIEDPLRSACAYVSLIGDGPLPEPLPRLTVLPRQAALYYRNVAGPAPPGLRVDNRYIDADNKRQRFFALLFDAPSTTLEWRVNGTLRQTGSAPDFLFDPVALSVSSGPDGLGFTVEARLQSRPEVRAEARAQLFNYAWPHT